MVDVPTKAEHDALAARVTMLEKGVPPTPRPEIAPTIGLDGYALAWEATPTTFPSLQHFRDNAYHDWTWGRINGELQRYVPFNDKNLKIQGDHFRLIATPTRGIGFDQIDSTNIIFKRTCPIQRGFILEFCMRMPKGVGHWPAGWAYPYSGGVDNSEIDTIESIYNNRDKSRDHRGHVFQGVIGKTGRTFFTKQDKWGKSTPGFDTSDGHHVYSTRYMQGRVTQFLDKDMTEDQEYEWKGPDPNIVANLACGSNTIDWPGKPEQQDFQNDHNVLEMKWARLFVPK